MSELKPCPFCGWNYAESAWNEFGDQYWVCDQCGATSGTVNSMWDWNTRPIEDALQARIAELKGMIEILEDQQREVKNILIDKNLHIDSLYEEGYKLQQRIAELEAAQRWIPVSERLPEANTPVLTISKDNNVATPIDVALRKRIAGLEGFINQLIEAGDAMSNAHSMWVAEEDKWDALVKDWKEREE